MSYPQPEQRYTLEEYYALCKASDRRWEFWDGELFNMSGGSKEHAINQGNVLKLQRKIPIAQRSRGIAGSQTQQMTLSVHP